MTPRSRKGTRKQPKPEQRADTAGLAWITRAGVIVILALTLVLVVYVRLRLADTPLERDEGEYAYAGQLILEGVPPYALAYNMKFPGTYYAYSVLMAVFGQTAWGIRVGLLCTHLLTAALLFVLGRRLVGTLAAGIGVAAFMLLALDRWSMGVFAHATHFVILPVVAGLLVMPRSRGGPPSPSGLRRRLQFVASGFLMGVAIAMKQQAFAFALLALGLAVFGSADGGWRERWRRAALVFTGTALFGILLIGLLAIEGTLDRFWFWTFQYAAAYVSETPASAAFDVLQLASRYITQSTAWFWFAGLAGLFLLLVTRWPAEARLVLAAWIAAAALSIAPGFFFRPHYFIVAMPVVGLLIGVAIASIDRLVARPFGTAAARIVSLLLFVAFAGAWVQRDTRYLFRMTPAELMREVYATNPFLESQEVSRYIAERTTPDDRIAVLGSEPQLFFYAHRRSATGYLYTYALMEPQPYAARMQDEMRSEIEVARPKYLVFVGVSLSWVTRPSSDVRILTWAQEYVAACYDRVGVVDIHGSRPSTIVWDAEAATYVPQSQSVVLTHRRKSSCPM